MENNRGTKFYRANEKETMEKYGMKADARSGAGPLFKSDGRNDYLICEYKSTEKASYSMKFDDIRKNEYHARTEHKIPIFITAQIFFDGDIYIGQDEWITLRPEHIKAVAEYLETGKTNSAVSDIVFNTTNCELKELKPRKQKIIGSGAKERETLKKEKEKKYEKGKSAI